MPAPRPGPYSRSCLLRDVRLVPVGGAVAPDRPVDLRVRDGVVAQVAPGLRPDRGETVHDGGGRWAVPGLWDSHVHLAQEALRAVRLDLSGSGSPSDVVRRVGAHVAGLGPGRRGELVQGFGYRSATWAEQPTVGALDAVSDGHPVVLVSGDGHNGWLGSRALELLGVAPRDTVLDEDEWFAVYARLPSLPGAREETERACRRAVEKAAALGVVGIVDMELAAGYRDWPERLARGTDLLRVRTATYPDRLEEVVAAGLRSGQELPGGGGLLTMGPLKVISDGSLGTRTAYCCEPYADAAEPGSWRGTQNWPPEQLARLLARARENGLVAAVHAIGDAAVHDALDALEASGAAGSIEHAQLVATTDIPRMARLGISASVQPAHLLDDRDATEQCWPDRADRCFPFRSLLDAGVTLVLGSDAPVAPLDPWLAMAAAVHRSGDARAPWHAEQALTAGEALAASTGGRGVPAPGDPGDVVLLDADPLREVGDSAAVAAHLCAVTVAATFVAGRPTHLAL